MRAFLSSHMTTFLFSLAAIGLIGCGGDENVRPEGPVTGFESEEAHEGPPRARYGNLPSSSPSAAYDLNRDGDNDQFHYGAGQLERIERDLNFDGVIDAYEYYSGGSMTEEEIDLDLDGRIDVARFYQGTIVARKRYATGFRADMTIERTYDADGQLVLVERDTMKGRVWEHFEPGNPKPIRVERDQDGDGKPDP